MHDLGGWDPEHLPEPKEELYRFGAFVHATAVRQDVVSANELARLSAEQGGPRARLRLRRREIAKLLRPYVGSRFSEQFRAVAPLAAYLFLFQMLVLRHDIGTPWGIALGLAAVVVGLMLFMEGLKLGLMPFGESIGESLPARASLPTVLIVVLLLGIGVTFAEPAIGALRTAGSIVDADAAPQLHALLNEMAWALVLAVGVGVGLAAVLGTLRFLQGWSLKPLIYLTVLPALALTLLAAEQPALVPLIGLAWDCGGITTGPVTVPLVLALGIGIAGAAGRGDGGLSGFGIVTLASIVPVIGVLGLGLWLAQLSPESVGQVATALAGATSNQPWYETSPGVEIVGGLRAILPLVLFMLAILRLLLGERMPHRMTTLYGITLTVLGMILFNLGLAYGLAALGTTSGALAPAAFTAVPTSPESPLYFYGLGVAIVLLFAWLLGYGATLAEPALNAMGYTVQSLTNGAFEKSTLMHAVSFGVGSGIALGVAKLIFGWSLVWLLLSGYFLALLLTWFSEEEYVNIAWDSAGVTTGPVTVPLVLALGLGLGGAVQAVDGFGILAMASVGPIISVLAMGLWVRWRIHRIHRRSDIEHMRKEPR